MVSDEVRKKIDFDPDWIAIKRFDFSLKKLLERYPEGVPVRIICQALAMEEKDVESLYNQLLEKLREELT